MPHSSKQQDEMLPQDTKNKSPEEEVAKESLAEDISSEIISQTEEVTETEGSAPQTAENGEEQEALTEPTAEKTLSFVYDMTELIAISFAIVIVVLCFFLRHSPVSGSSMETSIQDGDTLLVNNIAYTPKQGDVVIVQSLHNLERPLVKRVIAVGGDTISINFTRWLIEVNGVVYEQRLDADGNPAQIGGDYVLYKEGEPMLPPLQSSSSLLQIGFQYNPETDTYTATVPEGHIFILGDNRTDSNDSRNPSIGFVDWRLVVGKSDLRLSPLDKFGSLD